MSEYTYIQPRVADWYCMARDIGISLDDFECNESVVEFKKLLDGLTHELMVKAIRIAHPDVSVMDR